MAPLVVETLAVVSIYYLWRGYAVARHQQARLLRERVAMMLWKAAETVR